MASKTTCETACDAACVGQLLRKPVRGSLLGYTRLPLSRTLSNPLQPASKIWFPPSGHKLPARPADPCGDAGGHDSRRRRRTRQSGLLLCQIGPLPSCWLMYQLELVFLATQLLYHRSCQAVKVDALESPPPCPQAGAADSRRPSGGPRRSTCATAMRSSLCRSAGLPRQHRALSATRRML